MRQGDKVVEHAETQTHRQRRRPVTTRKLPARATVAALCATPKPRSISSPLKMRTSFASSPHRPIRSLAGKAYRCRRNGEKLEITDADGNIPPFDEFKIVSQNMDALGRPNPLADFPGRPHGSHRRKLPLPHEVAERLLGLGDDLGQVSRFELVLTDVKTVSGKSAACSARASTPLRQTPRKWDAGRWVARDSSGHLPARSSPFRGPLRHERTHGSLTEKYQLNGTGHISAKIATIYRDAIR